MNISQYGAVTTVVIDAHAGWEQWLCLHADNHHDSLTCNQELEREHLEEAKRRDAWIIFTGDFSDAMQGKFDPRRSYDFLRPEFKGEDYYDRIVRYNTAFLEPYAANILLLGDGNHEMAVLKNANTNLNDRIISHLNERTGSHIVHGGYGGWVRFLFNSAGIPKCSVKLKYFHGSGGEAPVTRGAIQTNRQAVYLPDADIVVNGHSHNSYHIPISRERLSGKGRLYFDIQHHIRVPGYSQSYGDGSGGWEVSRGGVPKPIGCAWVRLRWNASNQTVEICVESDIRGADVMPVSGDLANCAEYPQDGADDL